MHMEINIQKKIMKIKIFKIKKILQNKIKMKIKKKGIIQIINNS